MPQLSHHFPSSDAGGTYRAGSSIVWRAGLLDFELSFDVRWLTVQFSNKATSEQLFWLTKSLRIGCFADRATCHPGDYLSER